MKSGDLVNFEKVVEKFASQFQVRQEQQPGFFQRENKPSVFFGFYWGFRYYSIFITKLQFKEMLGYVFFPVNSGQEWSVIRLCSVHGSVLFIITR